MTIMIYRLYDKLQLPKSRKFILIRLYSHDEKCIAKQHFFSIWEKQSCLHFGACFAGSAHTCKSSSIYHIKNLELLGRVFSVQEQSCNINTNTCDTWSGLVVQMSRRSDLRTWREFTFRTWCIRNVMGRSAFLGLLKQSFFKGCRYACYLRPCTTLSGITIQNNELI